MKLRTLMIAAALVTACAACGDDDPEIQTNNDNNANNANNTTSNTPNNTTSNTPNNTTSNTPNNTTSNTPNNTSNTPNNTNGMTNSNPNNGNPLTCNGDFGAADACGGDPTGTWDVSEACTNFDYEAQIQQACSDAVVNDSTVNVGGTLTVDAATWSRTVTGDITFDLSTATGCGLGNCGLVEAGLGVVASSATCTDNGSGGCDCDAVVDLQSSSNGTYTSANGVITIGSGETFYYCSSGGTMLIRRFGTMGEEAEPTVLYTK